MASILCASELGQGYGPFAGFVPLARTLRSQGHSVSFAVRDLSRTDIFLSRDEFVLLQAPVWLPKTAGPSPPVNYADVLLRSGYLEPSGLESLVRGWRALFDLVEPELLLVDQAPTALLAASGLNLRRARFGSGFSCPPRLHPMPSLRPWLEVPEDRLLESERRVVAAVNTVLEQRQLPPLRALADLFTVDEDFLCTFAELDHYADRPDARYWGPRFGTTAGVNPEWPGGGRKRIFAYVQPGHPDFERLLQHFQEDSYSVLVHAPGIGERLVRRHRAAHLAFAPMPVQMARVTAECDLVVCHGGDGTVAASLLAGRPLLLLPYELEQTLTARAVVKVGAGLIAGDSGEGTSYKQLLRRACGDATYTERAQAWATRYADFDRDRQLERVAARAGELLRGQPMIRLADGTDAWR
jgi:hypothetical protein